jgi:hypothetical protein
VSALPAMFHAERTAPTIRLDDLRLALQAAVVRLRDAPVARFAAVTRGPMTPCACRDRLRDANPLSLTYHMPHTGVGPLDRGGIRRAIERTMRERGAAEVRRTWGVGYRRLMVEPLTLGGISQRPER